MLKVDFSIFTFIQDLHLDKSIHNCPDFVFQNGAALFQTYA